MPIATAKTRGTTTSNEAPAAPTTLADVSRAKMIDALRAYRRFVQRAAAGEDLTEVELGEVANALDRLALPDYAWPRDVEAQREYVHNAEREREAVSQLPAAEARAAESTARIKALEDELRRVRDQHHADVDTLPRRIAGCGQKRNELAMLHPHVFASIEAAADLRLRVKNKARQMPADPLGWSA